MKTELYYTKRFLTSAQLTEFAAAHENLKDKPIDEQERAIAKKVIARVDEFGFEIVGHALKSLDFKDKLMILFYLYRYEREVQALGSKV